MLQLYAVSNISAALTEDTLGAILREKRKCTYGA